MAEDKQTTNNEQATPEANQEAAPATPNPPAEQTAETPPPAEQPAPQAEEKKPEAPAPSTGAVAGDEKTLAGISYIPLLGFMTVTLKPNSPFCKMHGGQGIALTVVWFLLLVLFTVEGVMLGFTIISPLLAIGLIVLSIVGAIKAFQGQEWKIPVIGAFASKMPSDNKQPATNNEQKTTEAATPEEKPAETAPSEPQEPTPPASNDAPPAAQ